MQFLAIIKLVMQLLPIVIEAIKAIEDAFPVGGAGKAKMEVIKNTVESAYQVAGETTHAFETIWTPLSTMASAVVGLFNSTGLFKKSS